MLFELNTWVGYSFLNLFFDYIHCSVYLCIFRALFYYDQKNIHCFYFVIFKYTLLVLFWMKFLYKVLNSDERYFTAQIMPSF